jgi:alkanesulfonate monooxygenase SsuD/methylene tetrahydromethanopterin reductase-like flavin-dependent oxidoreductase (luciferase family)
MFLGEAFTVIRRLLSEDRVTFTVRHYQLHDALLNPRPIQQPHPLVVVGANGEQGALRSVAQHANMGNAFGSPDVFRHKIAILTEYCRKIGRDPDTIEQSGLMQMTLTDAPEVKRHTLEQESWGMFAGTPSDIRQRSLNMSRSASRTLSSRWPLPTI